MPTRGEKVRRLTVGDRVGVPRSSGIVEAEVIEDRGGLGVDGRQIVRIPFWIEGESEPHEFEMPVDELVPLSSAA